MSGDELPSFGSRCRAARVVARSCANAVALLQMSLTDRNGANFSGITSI